MEAARKRGRRAREEEEARRREREEEEARQREREEEHPGAARPRAEVGSTASRRGGAASSSAGGAIVAHQPSDARQAGNLGLWKKRSIWTCPRKSSPSSSPQSLGTVLRPPSGNVPGSSTDSPSADQQVWASGASCQGPASRMECMEKPAREFGPAGQPRHAIPG